jgi:hypothetical protein
MSGRECHHCKQWIEPGEAHDCWTTTEAALTRDLSENLREAWKRLRETAVKQDRRGQAAEPSRGIDRIGRSDRNEDRHEPELRIEVVSRGPEP